MKTFHEALGATLFAKAAIGEFDRIDAEVSRNQDRYAELLEQVQTDPEVHAMIRAMASTFDFETSSNFEMMVVAFAHGVMVGVEMEKQPLAEPHPVRTTPEPEREPEKEA